MVNQEQKEESKTPSCYGCVKGIRMCYTRPCWGTPEEFDKIIDAGFSHLMQLDFYYRKSMTGLPDIEVLSMGVHWDKNALFRNIEDLKNPIQALLAVAYVDDKDPIEGDYSLDHTGGGKANDNPKGKCVMLSSDNECLLHDMGLKPEQGRQACCKIDNDLVKDNLYYSKLWDTEKGKEVVSRWKSLVNYNA